MEHSPGIENEPALGREKTGDSSYWEATGDEPALRWTGRDDLPSFASIYRGKVASTTPARRWLAVAVGVVIAGPFAVLGAFLSGRGTASFALLLVVVGFGPLVEEVLKASGALYLAEQRPWLVPSGWVLPLMALAAGLVFAAIENLVYLNVYIPDPTMEIIRWRWIAGPLLHGGASFIVGLGVRRMWIITNESLTAPRLRHAAPFVVAGVVVHGLYNLTVTVLEATEVIF